MSVGVYVLVVVPLCERVPAFVRPGLSVCQSVYMCLLYACAIVLCQRVCVTDVKCYMEHVAWWSLCNSGGGGGEGGGQSAVVGLRSALCLYARRDLYVS